MDRAADPSPGIQRRRQRQRTEILGLITAGHPHRAADLAHEHLAEFADDEDLRAEVTAALRASADPALRRRAGELDAAG